MLVVSWNINGAARRSGRAARRTVEALGNVGADVVTHQEAHPEHVGSAEET